MKKGMMILAVAALALWVAVLPAAAAGIPALDYLATQQNPDGGFGSGFSPDSSVGSTADVVLAVVAAGGDPAAMSKDGNTPLTYLAGHGPAVVMSGDLAKLVLAAIATGQNPRTLGGVDSVAKLEGMLDAQGKIGVADDTLVAHSLAVLALKSAQRPVPAAAVAYITAAQQESGAWSWDATAATAADTNTTAFAVQALIAAGQPAGSAPVSKALAYYKAIQNPDGGWPYENPSAYGTATDANSTAVTIQALIAAGQDPAGAAWKTAEGGTPFAALKALQKENGAFAWQAAVPDDNLLATVQALPAIAGKAYPWATMAVGKAAATAGAAPAAPGAPATMPATGGAVLGGGLVLVLAGLALLGGGYALRRRGQ